MIFPENITAPENTRVKNPEKKGGEVGGKREDIKDPVVAPPIRCPLEVV